MTKHILIAGSGFAGTWAAITAAKSVFQAGKGAELAISVISPEPVLQMRPRLYETAFAEMTPDLLALFEAISVRYIAGCIEAIDAAARRVSVRTPNGNEVTLDYDRFVLATGSQLFKPDIPGLQNYSFNVDQLEGAKALDAHLQTLIGKPASQARNTVVVAGGGFTGIETAAELPERLRHYFGDGADIRVVIVEQAPAIGPDLGPVPRPVIEEALAEVGVEVLTGAAVVRVDAEGVELADGRRIPTNTVIWTAGMRANPLASQIAGAHDRLGRVHVDAYLRAPESPDIYIAGDVAFAATDTVGNHASMSCQHALVLGRVAGFNAAADLLGSERHAYSQVPYVTCLDIGPWGALFTEGWDRQVKLTRAEGKALKRQINTQWIYPPAPNRDAAFATANPDHAVVA
jgi:NADH dehydrogenase